MQGEANLAPPFPSLVVHPRILSAVQARLMDGRLFGSLVFVCLLEAYTTQIDNLVLPVVMSTLIVMMW